MKRQAVLNHLEIDIIRNKKLETNDPFMGLPYPKGATGLVVNVRGLVMAECKSGYFLVFREVKQSREYTAGNGEEMMGVTDWFLDTYWRFKTFSEARWFVKYFISKKDHYKQMFKPVKLEV